MLESEAKRTIPAQSYAMASTFQNCNTQGYVAAWAFLHQ